MICEDCAAPLVASERKYSGPCVVCGRATCPKHTFFYTDESNIAITDSARPRCKEHAI